MLIGNRGLLSFFSFHPLILGASRYGGACTAAAFLQHFVNKGVHWAHVDIAGPSDFAKVGAVTPYQMYILAICTVSLLFVQIYILSIALIERISCLSLLYATGEAVTNIQLFIMLILSISVYASRLVCRPRATFALEARALARLCLHAMCWTLVLKLPSCPGCLSVELHRGRAASRSPHRHHNLTLYARWQPSNCPD